MNRNPNTAKDPVPGSAVKSQIICCQCCLHQWRQSLFCLKHWQGTLLGTCPELAKNKRMIGSKMRQANTTSLHIWQSFAVLWLKRALWRLKEQLTTNYGVNQKSNLNNPGKRFYNEPTAIEANLQNHPTVQVSDSTEVPMKLLHFAKHLLGLVSSRIRINEGMQWTWLAAWSETNSWRDVALKGLKGLDKIAMKNVYDLTCGSRQALLDSFDSWKHGSTAFPNHCKIAVQEGCQN